MRWLWSTMPRPSTRRCDLLAESFLQITLNSALSRCGAHDSLSLLCLSLEFPAPWIMPGLFSQLEVGALPLHFCTGDR